MATIVKRARPAPAAPALAPTPATSARRVIPIKSSTPMDSETLESNMRIRANELTITRYVDRVKNPLTAIRARCVQCCNGSLKEVQECTVHDCALHAFRHGTNPLHKKTLDRAAREAEENGEE